MIDRYNVKNPTIGTLYITATHIIFVDPETNKETWVMKPLWELSNTINALHDSIFCRYFTCTSEASKNYSLQLLDRHCWFVAKRFCLSHLLYHVKKNAMIFMWHCKNYINQVRNWNEENEKKKKKKYETERERDFNGFCLILFKI